MEGLASVRRGMGRWDPPNPPISQMQTHRSFSGPMHPRLLISKTWQECFHSSCHSPLSQGMETRSPGCLQGSSSVVTYPGRTHAIFHLSSLVSPRIPLHLLLGASTLIAYPGAGSLGMCGLPAAADKTPGTRGFFTSGCSRLSNRASCVSIWCSANTALSVQS